MKKIISYILAFLMSIFLIVSIVFITISNTILNCDFVLNVLEKNDYYSMIDTKIKDGFKSYIKQSGLEEEVLENVYSEQKLKEDMEIIIKNTYNQEQNTINTDIIKDNLEANIAKYLEKNDITLNENKQENIEDYVSKLLDTYKKEVSHPVYLETAEVVISKISDIIFKCNTIVYAIFLSLFFVVIIINTKDKYRVLKYIGISILMSGFFIIFGILMINLKININNIIILNEEFSLLLRELIKTIIKRFVFIGIIISFISIIMITLCNMKSISLCDNKKK